MSVDAQHSTHYVENLPRRSTCPAGNVRQVAAFVGRFHRWPDLLNRDEESAILWFETTET
jgi:hypothetical protein